MGGDNMTLILLIFLVAVYNATAAAMGWRMRWSVALYWMCVAAYWMMRGM